MCMTCMVLCWNLPYITFFNLMSIGFCKTSTKTNVANEHGAFCCYKCLAHLKVHRSLGQDIFKKFNRDPCIYITFIAV